MPFQRLTRELYDLMTKKLFHRQVSLLKIQVLFYKFKYFPGILLKIQVSSRYFVINSSFFQVFFVPFFDSDGDGLVTPTEVSAKVLILSKMFFDGLDRNQDGGAIRIKFS